MASKSVICCKNTVVLSTWLSDDPDAFSTADKFSRTWVYHIPSVSLSKLRAGGIIQFVLRSRYFRSSLIVGVRVC